MMAHDIQDGVDRIEEVKQSPEEVKNNIILDIDDIIKKEEQI